MKRPSKLLLFGSSASAAGLAVAVLASCAESNDGGSESEAGPPSVLDGEIPRDAVSDAMTCDAADPRCNPAPTSCEESDFCPVATGIDPHYALTSVWGSSANDVWAVGSAGTILHFDGATWKPTPANTRQTLHAVGGNGPSDIWITSTPDIVFHSSGFDAGSATWTLAPLFNPDDVFLPVTRLLTSVWASGGDVWIGGEPFIHWGYGANGQWRKTAPGTEGSWEGVSTYCAGSTGSCRAVSAVWGSSRENVWTVGAGGWVMHSKNARSEDGSAPAWTQVDSRTTADLRAIWGSSATDIWTVGTSGTIAHSKGDDAPWEIAYAGEDRLSEDLHGVWGSGPNDVWAVGDSGTILHFDGVAWGPASAAFPEGDKPHLFGVWGSGPSDVWIVGAGIVLHFTGEKR